jgi:hypothetical protein
VVPSNEPERPFDYKGELKLFAGDDGLGVAYQGGYESGHDTSFLNHEVKVGIFGTSAEFNVAKWKQFDSESFTMEWQVGTVEVAPGDIEATIVKVEEQVHLTPEVDLKVEMGLGFATPFKLGAHGNRMEFGARTAGPWIFGGSLEVDAPPVPTPDLAAPGTANVVARSGEAQFLYWLLQATSIY